MSTDQPIPYDLPLLDAVRYQGPVRGFTHTIYKYPARFSPVFARSAIETFSRVGDTVFDPFVGGGTTLVEAMLSGRHGLGSDISSLAVFLSQAKTTMLSPGEIDMVRGWLCKVSQSLNIHSPLKESRESRFANYDKNMPWRIRKLCEQYLELLAGLPSPKLQRFARCVILRCGQWALDCRKNIPSVDEFRENLLVFFEEAAAGMGEYYSELSRIRRNHGALPKVKCIQRAASELTSGAFGKSHSEKAKLVVTSPPYPGIHVLYHRWNVRTRRETPAPFWLAGCMDGHGNSHYTLGGRHANALDKYFDGIRNAFTGIQSILADDGIVVQMVAFSSPDSQVNRYLAAMADAGFVEILPKRLGIDCDHRLWRKVPGRRWYSMMRGQPPSSHELVLFHKKRC